MRQSSLDCFLFLLQTFADAKTHHKSWHQSSKYFNSEISVYYINHWLFLHFKDALDDNSLLVPQFVHLFFSSPSPSRILHHIFVHSLRIRTTHEYNLLLIIGRYHINKQSLFRKPHLVHLGHFSRIITHHRNP